ncbi:MULTISPECIES: class II holin family protein [Pectobacterium]|uniref:class II holin family protein n=1 Tax=Pectobacterium TaxID=122277 RepID=UPI0005C60A79|nr:MULTISPECIES: class II holin family protein [Pectobacterium]QHP58554.1 holin [Pectobacterium carotovorum subsp. carotovorum]
MKIMPEKIATGIAYGASGGSTGFWLLQLLDKVSPTQWAAIGVIGSLAFGLLTYITSLYFQRRRAKAYEEALRRGYTLPPSN